MTGPGSVSVGRRADRAAVILGLGGLTIVAWILTLQLVKGMSMPAGPVDMASAMSSARPHLMVVVGMWAAMMVGMMIPSATPMIVAYADWTRQGANSRARAAAVGSFLTGYLFVWLAFSLLAAATQLTLERIGVLNGAGATVRPALGGAVLVLAGLFQVTSWKESCLSRCRTPVGFLIAEWREGLGGGLIMGIRHGVYCLGCCWALMGLLFVVGTMHVVGMAVIAGFILAEKVTPRVLRLRYVAAVVLIAWGGSTLLHTGA